MGESFLFFKTALKKILIASKIPCPQSPSFLVARPFRLLREAKRAIGTRMHLPRLRALTFNLSPFPTPYEKMREVCGGERAYLITFLLRKKVIPDIFDLEGPLKCLESFDKMEPIIGF